MLRKCMSLILLFLSGISFSQSESVTFEIEIYRVDTGPEGESFVPVVDGVPNELFEYRIYVTNTSRLVFRPGTVVISVPLGGGVTFVPESLRTNEPAKLEFSADGVTFLPFSEDSFDVGLLSTARFVRVTFLEPFVPEQVSGVAYRVVLDPGNPLAAAPGKGPVPSQRTASCCRYCSTGKPCGDACIARAFTCSVPTGCACYASGDPVDTLVILSSISINPFGTD